MRKIEVLSIVSFNNPARVEYLERSFKSFHSYYPAVRHVVIDGSDRLGHQVDVYKKLGIEFYHEKTSFSERLKFGLELIESDYFVFLPDDFVWIFNFPIEKAIDESREYGLDELKLTCKGMPWFAERNPEPLSWHQNGKLNSGEGLVKVGNLFVSEWTIRRAFTEQFSLACNIIRKKFIKSLMKKIPDNANSPGKVEKWAYGWLYLRLNRYAVGYYKMWIPAFHFIDLDVEGVAHSEKAKDMLIEENFALYNEKFNS